MTCCLYFMMRLDCLFFMMRLDCLFFMMRLDCLFFMMRLDCLYFMTRLDCGSEYQRTLSDALYRAATFFFVCLRVANCCEWKMYGTRLYTEVTGWGWQISINNR
jgi:hypothetical protein